MPSSISSVAFLDLPNEIIQHIISLLPASSISSVSQTCRRFHTVIDAIIWRHFCRQFIYWNPDWQIKSKFQASLETNDWKSTFMTRYRNQTKTTALLNSILSSQVGRIDKFQSIVDIGYDAKDCLLKHLAVDDNAEDVLARR
jgi:F-box protein 21